MAFPLWAVPLIAVILWAARWLEKTYPVERDQPNPEVWMDWKLTGIRIGMDQLIAPLTAGFTILVINTAGGGLLELRSDGYWFVLSLVIIVIVNDLIAYIVHRASHRIPVLWAMHSLHHSAESLSIITGARHFWVEDAIDAAAFSVIGIVFKVPPEIIALLPLIHVLPCGLSHLNARVSFGRCSLVVNNPQYHRIHHSIEPQHWDKNFCQLLPVFDVLFGTAWKPGKDEFPMTGLVPRERATALDGLIWPLRHKIPVLAR